MKKSIIIYFLLVLTCISCVDKYDKNLKDVLGEWTLQEMSYTNSSGQYVLLDSVSSSIIFTNDNLNANTKDQRSFDKLGTLIVDGDSMEFNYQFHFSQNTINIEIEQDWIRKKPIYTFGKMQVNDFELADKKNLVFSNLFEVVYLTDEKLTDPVFVFVQ